MYFADSTSKDGRSHLNHLKTIPYWHRPAGGLIETVSAIRELSGSFNGVDNEQMEIFIGCCLASIPMTVVQLAPVYDWHTISVKESIEKAYSYKYKLIYLDGNQVMYGLRPNDKFPKILSQ